MSITQETLVKEFTESLDTMRDIMVRKNADYAGTDNAFKNFQLVEQLGITSVEQGMLVRMCDKMSRISTLIASGEDPKVLDEKIGDTLTDMANYALLLKVYIQNK